jgi:hypothetical protein
MIRNATGSIITAVAEALVQRRRKKAKVMTVLILAARASQSLAVMTTNQKLLRNLKVRKKARVMTVPILAARASQSLEVMTKSLHLKVLMRPNAKFLRGHWKSIFQILGANKIVSHQVI